MLAKIKENKVSVIFLVLFFMVLVFCHLNTFILNDDLPYSLYFRENNRITNITGVIANQLFDYVAISPRIFIHMIVQTLLIFNKTLWSFLNPLVIITIIILMAYIIKKITNTKVCNIYLVLASTASFLLLYNYKYLVYWIAGSVNYVWVFLLMLLFIIYYLKLGFLRKPVLTSFICLILSMLCEALAIFVIIMLISDFIIKLIKNKDKKLIFKYIMFIACAVAGLLFLLLAPSTIGRMEIDSEFASLNIFEKIMLTLPVISSNIFKIDIYNLFPLLLLISIFYYGNVSKNKKILISLIPLLIIYVITFIVDLNYLYIIIALYFFILQVYILKKQDNLDLLPILLGAYAVSYSLMITNEYSAGRTNFHFFLIISLFTLYNFYIIESNTSIIKVITVILVIITITIEIIIYAYMGEVKEARIEAIKKVQNGETKVLEVKMLKSPFDKFHIDANNPADKNYWAYAAYEDYYKLPKDVKIKPVE